MRMLATACVALALTLGGCTTGSGGAVPTPAAPPGGATSQAATSPADTDPEPATCGISPRAVSLFIRDWQRVVDSVGSQGQATYTRALLGTVRSLDHDGADCPGADDLGTLRRLAQKINAAAVDGIPDLAAMDTFRTRGNAWLEKMGYGPQLQG